MKGLRSAWVQPRQWKDGLLGEVESATSIAGAVELARRIVTDPTFPTVRQWADHGGKAVACFPVYTPQELVQALGLLPVGIHGGGEAVELTKADAALGSFLCSISKSTLELALTGRLDACSGFIFPYICDVSRNLEGVFARRLPGKVTHMLHLPQNFESKGTIPFLVAEYQALVAKLETIAGAPYDPARLAAAIRQFNEQRRLLRNLTTLKRTQPWRVTLEEHYLLARLGTLVPRDVHVRFLRRILPTFAGLHRSPRDAIRVLIVGPYCEQPPLELLQLIEDAGCYVVGDELQMLPQWYDDVRPGSNPLESLAAAYVRAPVDIGVRKGPRPKADSILERVRRSDAQGVVFLTAKFCEPALEDVVLYERALDAHDIPSLHLEFEEKSSGYEQSRLAVETFVESMLFD